jgi:hypothetical protein
MAFKGMTTSDDWWREKERRAQAESAALRQVEAREAARARAEPAPLRPRREREAATLEPPAALRRRELGEPGSYGGQSPLSPEHRTAARQRGMALGATGEPVEVIRGMTPTYAGSRAGGEEYATVGQARQAFRRDLGEGEYVPPGGALAALQGRMTGAQHLLDEKVKARNIESFTNRILGEELGRFAQRDPEGRLAVNPVFEPLLLRLQERAMVDPEGAWEEFEKQAPRLLQESKLVTAEGIAQAMENFHKTMGRPLTEAEKMLLNPQDDPGAERARRAWIVQWATHTPGAGGIGGVVGGETEPGPLRPAAAGMDAQSARSLATTYGAPEAGEAFYGRGFAAPGDPVGPLLRRTRPWFDEPTIPQVRSLRRELKEEEEEGFQRRLKPLR